MYPAVSSHAGTVGGAPDAPLDALSSHGTRVPHPVHTHTNNLQSNKLGFESRAYGYHMVPRWQDPRAAVWPLASLSGDFGFALLYYGLPIPYIINHRI